MRFDDVARRLAALPAPPPPPPAVLMPVRLDVAGGIARETVPLDRLRERPAAVLALVHPDAAGEARVLLTERMGGGRHHGGEVSFPGGATEPHDAGPIATAIREAAEEVGLDRAAAGVRVVGLLDSFWIPVSGFRVTPVVALAAHEPVGLRPSPAEVARIIQPPLDGFLPGARIEIVERDLPGRRLRYGAYPVDDLLVWGATARILGQLAAIVARADGASPRPDR